MSSCPSRTVLEHFSSGIEPSLASTVELDSHIETCSSCQSFLDSWISADHYFKVLRQPSPLKQFRRDTRFAELIALSGVQPQNKPETISHFRIIKKIGEGGMGVVYKAWDSIHEREVAVKTIPIERFTPVLADRFRREILACSRVSHPHVVSMHDSGIYRGVPYYAMDFLHGLSLFDWIKTCASLTLTDIVTLTEKIAGAVAHCHEQNIFHRDINAFNVFMSKIGEPVLGDFGISKILDRSDLKSTRTGRVPGTPIFMPPEQKNGGQVDRRSDVYGIGTVLVYCLVKSESGVNVNSETPLEEYFEYSTLRSIHDNDLRAICKKCLAQPPNARYESASELQADLNRWLSKSPTFALKEERRKFRRRACKKICVTA